MKPSITPARDAVMAMIPEIHDRCDQLVLSGSDAGDARMVKRIMPEIMMAMADEIDLERTGTQILTNIEAAIGNSIASVARTISSKEQWPLAETVEAFATRIAERAMRLADTPDADIDKIKRRIKRPEPKPKKGKRN
jgi:hypothetical protein